MVPPNYLYSYATASAFGNRPKTEKKATEAILTNARAAVCCLVIVDCWHDFAKAALAQIFMLYVSHHRLNTVCNKFSNNFCSIIVYQ